MSIVPSNEQLHVVITVTFFSKTSGCEKGFSNPHEEFAERNANHIFPSARPTLDFPVLFRVTSIYSRSYHFMHFTSCLSGDRRTISERNLKK